MEAMVQNIRFAYRALRHSAGVTLLAVACMGLGIGSVATIYATASAFTFRPLPQVRGADRLMHVWEAPSEAPRRSEGISPTALEEVLRLGVFSSAAAVTMWEANVAGVDLPERVRAARVSPSFLHTLGRIPALGRDFVAAEEDAGNDRVVLLTHGLWQRRFGGDRSVIGRTVRINGEGYEVIGVLPEDFVFPAGCELLVPLGLTPEARADRGNRVLLALARRGPGVSESEAAAAVAALGARLAAGYPQTNAEWAVFAEAAEDWFGSGPRPFMWVLLASSVFVLLIACANVANLLLVRATSRRREIAMRIALGASRGRIVSQLLGESVLIAAAGGVVGLLFALWGMDAMQTGIPVEVRTIIPGFGQLRVDARAVGVSVLVAMGAGLLAGLAPALTAARGDLQPALKEGGRGDTGGSSAARLRSVLVVAEVALALSLLAGATLMTITFRRLVYEDPGFRSEGVLTLGVTLPEAEYPGDTALRAFAVRLEERLGALPGVAAVGATTVLPMAWQEQRIRVLQEGRQVRRPDEAPIIGMRRVSEGYLGAVAIPLRSGRGLDSRDDVSSPDVALVSEAAANQLWPGEDAVGKRLVMRQRPVEIVGVVGNVKGNVLMTEDPLPVVYVPLRQWPTRSPTFVLRTAGDPAALTPQVQGEIASLDSRLAAGDISSMPRVVLAAVSPQRATAQTLMAAAVIALVMAVVGTYGVLAYSVAQRTQEIGVRMALGASTRDIVTMVMRRAALLCGSGIAIGLASAVAMGRGMRAILYDTDAADPTVLGAAVLTLGAVSLIAAWIPARRAARVDPVEALRNE